MKMRTVHTAITLVHRTVTGYRIYDHKRIKMLERYSNVHENK